MRDIPDGSIHFSIYSPPFGGLYHYSSSEKDLSNSDSYEKFFEHYEYFIKEKARITMPGRMSAVHAADVPSGNSGNDHLTDFTGDVIRAHEKYGWKFVARYMIWKEPLRVRNRTMAKGLAHKTIIDDGTKCTNAAADYILVFRNAGENKVPVKHSTGLTYYAGGTEVPKELLKYRGWTGDQKENRYSHWIWRRYASCVWDDVRIERVLPFQQSKDEDDEKHVHPLQLDVIERAVVLWSNEGEKVFTPFMGVGSEVYGAVLNNRKGIGVELKTSYFKQAKLNLKSIKREDTHEPSLFDGLEV
jgi:DNA modification methylase